jgi:hypothetical protein
MSKNKKNKKTDIWFEFSQRTSYDDEFPNNFGHKVCGLCGNTGFVEIKEKQVRTPAGFFVKPFKQFCICPNGRINKKKNIDFRSY